MNYIILDNDIKTWFCNIKCNIDTNIGVIDNWNILLPEFTHEIENITHINFRDTNYIPVAFIMMLSKFKNLNSIHIQKCNVANDIVMYLPNLKSLVVKDNNLPPLDKTNPNLKYLKLIQDSDEYVEYRLPQSLEVFEYKYYNSKSFNSIKHLKKLKKINLICNQDKKKIVFNAKLFAESHNLEQLTITNYPPQNLLKITQNIPNLKKIKFVFFKDIFNQQSKITDISNIKGIPKLILKLEQIKYDMSWKLTNFIVPNISDDVEVLHINYNCIDANVIINNLPNSLKILKITKNDIPSAKLNNLPISLEKLYLNFIFCEDSSIIYDYVKENIKIPFGCELYINGEKYLE